MEGMVVRVGEEEGERPKAFFILARKGIGLGGGGGEVVR